MKRILLADPNPAPRSALALLLEKRAGARILGQVSNMEMLLIEAAASQPDFIMLDWELPGDPRNDRLAAIKRIAPGARIVVLSARPEHAAAAANADFFFNKCEPPEAILNCLTMTSRGGEDVSN